MASGLDQFDVTNLMDLETRWWLPVLSICAILVHAMQYLVLRVLLSVSFFSMYLFLVLSFSLCTFSLYLWLSLGIHFSVWRQSFPTYNGSKSFTTTNKNKTSRETDTEVWSIPLLWQVAAVLSVYVLSVEARPFLYALLNILLNKSFVLLYYSAILPYVYFVLSLFLLRLRIVFFICCCIILLKYKFIAHGSTTTFNEALLYSFPSISNSY